MSAVQWLRQVPRRLATGLVHAYQLGIAPMLGPACRYEPSCSAYAIEAIKRYGVMRGSWLAMSRIIRCNPLGGHGLDPLP